MEEKIINTLKNLMSFITVRGNSEEFRKIFDYIKKTMNKKLYLKEYEFDNNISLVISNTTDVDLDVVFCGHIDVVPASKYEFLEDDENVFGRGAIDMKGSVAVMLELFKKLDTKKKTALFITSDEEVDGNCTYQLLKIYRPKFAIIPDAGSDFSLISEEKGLLQLKLSITGSLAHSSQPFNGVNAIELLIDIYKKIIDKYPLPKSCSEYITSVNLSKINGGVQNNQVPDYAEMVLDIRHVFKDKKEEILKFIKSLNKYLVVEEILSGSVFKTDIDNLEIKRYISVAESALKRKIKISGCESTSDGVYFSDLGIPTVLMNPNGYYAHSDGEYVNKKSLVDLYNIYEKFLKGDDLE